MSNTPDFDPNDAIIPITSNRKVVDLGKYILGQLREDWNPANTDGQRPRIEFAETMKSVVFSSGDYITFYMVSELTEPVSAIYDFVNETYTFTLDMFTSGSREHIMKLYEEARRVLLSHRRDTVPVSDNLTGRMWLEWAIRSTPYDRTGKNFYRRTVDCRINWRYRSISNV